MSFCLLLLSRPVWAVASETTIAANVAVFFVGEEKVVEDTVTAAERDGNVVRLHLGKPPQDMMVSLIIGLLSNFPPSPEQYYLGKPVRVAGTIRSFRGAPEMEIHDPAHIQLVAGTQPLPPSAPAMLKPPAVQPAVPPPAVAPPEVVPPAVTAVRLPPEDVILLRRIEALSARVRQLERRVQQLESQKNEKQETGDRE